MQSTVGVFLGGLACALAAASVDAARPEPVGGLAGGDLSATVATRPQAVNPVDPGQCATRLNDIARDSAEDELPEWIGDYQCLGVDQVSGDPRQPDADADVFRHTLVIDLGGILTRQLEEVLQQDSTLVCDATALADPANANCAAVAETLGEQAMEYLRQATLGLRTQGIEQSVLSGWLRMAVRVETDNRDPYAAAATNLFKACYQRRHGTTDYGDDYPEWEAKKGDGVPAGEPEIIVCADPDKTSGLNLDSGLFYLDLTGEVGYSYDVAISETLTSRFESPPVAFDVPRVTVTEAPSPGASPAVPGVPYEQPGTLCGWDDDAQKWNLWTDLDGLCERLSAQVRSQLGATLEGQLFDTPTAEQIATCRGTTTAIPCATGIDCPSSECVHSTVELTNPLGVTQVVEGPSLCAKTEDELTNCALPLARVLEQTATDLIGALMLKAGAADLVGDGEVKTARVHWVSSGVTGDAAATGAVACGAATDGSGLKLVWEARRCASP